MTLKPRILIIENSVDVTGALKSICAMTKELSSDFEFMFVVPSGSRSIPWINSHLSVRIFEVPMIEISRSWRSLFLYIPSLLLNSIRVKRIIRDNGIDIVHSNDLYNLVPPVLKFFGGKFQYVCHIRFLPGRFPPMLFNFWLRQQLKYASSLMVVSGSLRRQLPANPGIVTVYDRIFKEHDAFAQNAPEKKVLLYLSNVIPGKGHDVAIDVLRRLHDDFKDWRMRFVGGDMGLEKNRQYRKSLERQSADISHVIEWKDFTANVEDEYRDADIVLNFSESESFSMTCLEGQYCGRTVVATRSGGPEEIVEHEITGFLVPPGDVNVIAAAVKQLLVDRNLRDRMGRKAAERMRVKFGPETTSGILKEIYNNLRAR
jgi:glycosyltransferase involved in cell wall biosynthesis